MIIIEVTDTEVIDTVDPGGRGVDWWLLQRGSAVNFHVKRWLPLCLKRWSPLHMKRRLPLLVKRWLHLHVKRQLPLHVKGQSTLCMKRWSPLLILGGWQTINAERINSQLLHAEVIAFSCAEANCLFTWRGNHPFMDRGNRLFTCKGNHLFTWKLTVDPLCNDHQSIPPGSTVSITSALITSMTIINPPRINSVNHLCINCLYDNHWSPGSTVLITYVSIASVLIASIMIINPPGSTEVITFSHAEAITFSHREEVGCWFSLWWSSIPQHDQQAEMVNRFWAKLCKHVSMCCFTEDIPFGKVQLISHKDKHCNSWAFTYQIMCSPMANCMLLSAQLQTHQFLLCAWIAQMDLQETLCFRKFCDFPCTLCPEPWDLCAPRHSVQSTGWPLVGYKTSTLNI